MPPANILATLNAAHTWGLSTTALRILLMIATGKSKHSSDMSRQLGITTAGIHCALKPLVNRRILRKRRSSQDDERLVNLQLTTYGRSILDAVLTGNLSTETPGAERNRNTETPLPTP